MTVRLRGNLAGMELSKKERMVALLIARGHTNKEIARICGRSYWTIKNHLDNIYQKLELHTRLELALYIREQIGESNAQRDSSS